MPTPSRFFRFDLRTTDEGAARAFYTRLLGHDRATIWPLHEEALARGAKPHWLGHIAVDDVDRAAPAFAERGAKPLRPTFTRDGVQIAILRDPGGALLALASAPPPGAPGDAGRVDVVWHVLRTSEAAKAATTYHELFGWELTERLEVAGHGPFQKFAWQPGGPSVGAIGDIAETPGVHPQWLFFFEVPELDAATALTREAGGVLVEPSVLPGGERVCVCDDPQGAAFGLWERRERRG